MGADEERGGAAGSRPACAPGGGGQAAGEAEAAAAGAGEDCYVLFPGHTDGWLLFDALKAAGVGARIAPTPRAARSTCGMSLLVSCDDCACIEEEAAACGATVERIVRLARQIRPDRDRYC